MFDKLDKICEHFGLEEQISKKLPEELRELITECERKDKNEDDFVDEVADVLNLILQILHAKDWFKKVNGRMDFKVARTLDRISSGYYEKEKQ